MLMNLKMHFHETSGTKWCVILGVCLGINYHSVKITMKCLGMSQFLLGLISIHSFENLEDSTPKPQFNLNDAKFLFYSKTMRK